MTLFPRQPIGHSMRAAWMLALFVVLVGCARRDAPPGEGGRMATRAVDDDLGRRVDLPSPVRRIVSLAPACTEILFAVGAGDRVVGVTTFDNYPPEVKSIASVGGFSRETINVEQLVALDPDLILSSGSLQRDLIDELSRLGLVTVALEPESLEDVRRNIELVGEITDCVAGAKQAVAKIDGELAGIRAAVSGTSAMARPRVFYQVWDRPLRTAGATSFLGHLIEAAGGQNIFGELAEAYPLVSEESLIDNDPQVILLAHREGQDARQLFARPGMEQMEAVRLGRIHALDEDLMSRPGPRIGEAVRAMAEVIHPGLLPGGLGGGASP